MKRYVQRAYASLCLREDQRMFRWNNEIKYVLSSLVVLSVMFVCRNLLTHGVLRNFLVSFGILSISLYLCTQKCLIENKYDNGKRLL